MARAAFQPPNLALPDQGTMAMAIALDFTLANNVAVDITPEFMDGKLDFVQSVYIDNADNSAPIDLIFAGAPIPQRVRAQAYSQGFYAVSWPKGAGRLTARTAQGQTVNVIFYNCAMPYVVWGPTDGVTVVPPLNNLALDAVPIAANGNLQLVAGAPLQSVKLYRGSFSVDAPTILRWRNGPGGAVLFSAQLFAGGSMFFAPSGIPWFAANPGIDLTLNSSAACNLYGGYGYVQG